MGQEEGASNPIEPEKGRDNGGARPIVDREIIINESDCETVSEDRRLALLNVLN
jgi:hypothetical protein